MQSAASHVIIGTLYTLVDGAITGAVFAWVYSLFAAAKRTEANAIV